MYTYWEPWHRNLGGFFLKEHYVRRTFMYWRDGLYTDSKHEYKVLAQYLESPKQGSCMVPSTEMALAEEQYYVSYTWR